jgi:predicted RNase H-like nuclease
MSKLLVGFDSAWTPNNSGAIAAALHCEDGSFQPVSKPQIANYSQATQLVANWQARFTGTSTLIMLDQPTIVVNHDGQRPVEAIVSSSVSARLCGMQPANLRRLEMFGPQAPVWKFLQRFGGPANPALPSDMTIYETYPVLTLIALGWTLPHKRASGRLPKYNPARRKTFLLEDWRHVCSLASAAFLSKGLTETASWLSEAADKAAPRKTDQDSVDACLCLLTAIHLADGGDGLFVGDFQTGYIVAPHSQLLFDECTRRCNVMGRNPSDYVRVIRNGTFAEAPAGKNPINGW